MTDWSDDPMEVRMSCFHQARKMNRTGNVDKIMTDAQRIERFIKSAKPKAKKLKLHRKNTVSR